MAGDCAGDCELVTPSGKQEDSESVRHGIILGGKLSDALSLGKMRLTYLRFPTEDAQGCLDIFFIFRILHNERTRYIAVWAGECGHGKKNPVIDNRTPSAFFSCCQCPTKGESR